MCDGGSVPVSGSTAGVLLQVSDQTMHQPKLNQLSIQDLR